MSRKTRISATGLLFAFGFGFGAAASAEEAAPKYGTTALSVVTIFASGFQPHDPATSYQEHGDGYWSGGRVSAPLILPTGAVIHHIDLETCDTNFIFPFDVRAFLQVCASNGTCTFVSGVGTQDAPGCVRIASVPNDVVVDNEANSYSIVADANNASTKFRAVRVYYRLQVSPAPAIATFTDVPVGHPFHRFVEALVAAGVTAGCGGGNYCVNNPISRGEMAVFLSVALGLHFAP